MVQNRTNPAFGWRHLFLAGCEILVEEPTSSNSDTGREVVS